MSCGVGCGRGSDPVLLWLWHKLEATAPIQPLTWEPPYAVGSGPRKGKKTKKKEKERKKKRKKEKNLNEASLTFYLTQ